MVTGLGCLSPNQLDKERTPAYRTSAGPDSWSGVRRRPAKEARHGRPERQGRARMRDLTEDNATEAVLAKIDAKDNPAP